MPNSFTDLAADMYKAADTVGRELVGFIPSCTINADGSERVAKGDVVRAHFTRKPSLVDVTPSMTIPEGNDITVDNKTVSITKYKAAEIPLTGEDQKHLDNGAGYKTVYGDVFAQAIRVLTNEIEQDLAAEAYKNASRAIGTAGATPFGPNFNQVATVRKILADNGMPFDGQVSLVMDTAAGANLRKLAQLQSVDSAGNDVLLRQGTLLDLQGFRIKESAGIVTHTKGTGTGYLVNKSGGHAVDDAAITVDTGSGTIVAGDIVTFAGDGNKYVVNTALSGSSLSIGTPGLREAAADNAALTVGNSYTPNVAFHRSALELVIRPAAQPEGGDAAVEELIVQDPHSGLVFELRKYVGYGKAMFKIGAAWGYKAWKPDFIATVMG